MAIFSKLGIAITNGTAVTLNEIEVKLLSQTSVGDYLLLTVTAREVLESTNYFLTALLCAALSLLLVTERVTESLLPLPFTSP